MPNEDIKGTGVPHLFSEVSRQVHPAEWVAATSTLDPYGKMGGIAGLVAKIQQSPRD
jgi:hypothetical protein